MLIGIVGAPNKGKSTFFSALTHAPVQIANYPFTTIDPNKGVALLPVPCACKGLGLPRCDARSGCRDGVRLIPIQVMDVAGLVPDAHLGRGMGNQFLDDLAGSDGFVQVVDASGQTDLEGRAAQEFPLEQEASFLHEEIAHWLASILMRNLPKFRGRDVAQMASVLSNLRVDETFWASACRECGVEGMRIELSEEQALRMARLIAARRPSVVAANKCDIPQADMRARRAAQAGMALVRCSADYELALVAAAKKGLVDYRPGAAAFAIGAGADARQREALERIARFVRDNEGTGVHRALGELVFGRLGMIVVYPVEDENRYCDAKGRVLPDAILLPPGATAHDLAGKVHSDFADKFIGALDARTKRRIGRDHPLRSGDVIKIIAAR